MDSYDKLEARAPPTDIEDAYRILQGFSYVDFPFISTKSLEFGLFKTYAIPSISSLLVKTAELTDRCAKRYDDTDLLIREFTENSPSSSRARRAIQRLNALHGKYKTITNEEYLYVLSVFVVEPIRWVDRFGYRKAHSHERTSSYMVWRDIGMKMGIKDIPTSYAAMEEYLEDYEEKFMKFHTCNAKLAGSTSALFLSIIPSFLRPAGMKVVHALCDRRLRAAMGFPDPPAILTAAVHALLYLSAIFTRILLPPRSTPYKRTPRDEDLVQCSDGTATGCPRFHPYEKTYMHGYRIDELGPEQFIRARELGKIFE